MPRRRPFVARAISWSCLVVAASSAQQVAADDWPHWRGPAGDGVSAETGWASVGRAEDLWRARAGLGYTSASVSDGRLYTLGHDVDAAEDRINCLDATTGEHLWTHAHAAQLMDQDHTGGALSTPAVDDDRVYVSTREGRLRCLDAATGEVRWSIDVVADHGLQLGPYGFGGSPVVVDDHVYVNMEHTFAFDKRTGDLAWKSDPLEVVYSTPAPLELGGRPCLAVFAQPGLMVLDRTSGETLHMHPWKIGRGAVNASTPVVLGERVFISSAYNHGCTLLEFGDEGATALWANKRIRNKMAGCVIVGETIFGFDESVLKALDMDGNEVWRQRGLGNGSLVAAGNRLIIMSSRGELIIADATSDEYRELSRERIFEEGTFWSPPVIADGLIYARSSLGEVVCRDHRSAGPDDVATSGPDVTDLPAAADLFARHLELIGGANALRDHPARTLSGMFEMRSVGFSPVPFTIHRLAPNHWHSKVKSPGGRPGHVARFFNGAIAYELNPHPSYGNTLFEPDALREIHSTSPIDIEADFDAAYTSMHTVGVESFDGRACHVVETMTREGIRRRVYFEVATGFIAGRSAANESIAVFDDYRDFDGLMIATLRKHFVLGTGIEETYRVESVSFEAIDEALWEVPVVIRELLDASAPDDGS